MDKSNQVSRTVLGHSPKIANPQESCFERLEFTLEVRIVLQNFDVSTIVFPSCLITSNLNRERKVATTMLPGMRVQELRKNVDERGSFAEIFREDWRDFFGEDKVIQSNLSHSYPGVIRAWHRHSRGQVDYLVVLKGALKICAYDDTPASPTRGQLSEIVTSGERLEVVRVPGSYWHGTMTLGNQPSLTVYFLNRLYNAKSPDEERRPWNDPTIVDPRVSQSYDWNKPSHK